ASGLGATPVAGAAPRAEVSPPFAIGSPAALFGDRVADVVSFFQLQRDGADVIPGPLHRKPAHLRDRALA
ncbi:MAG: endoglucanase, partial [Gaiellales bacterium]|nr:endoglucanase [Gaiellales bacterium]